MIIAFDLWFGSTGFSFTVFLFEFETPKIAAVGQIKILGRDLYNSEVVTK